MSEPIPIDDLPNELIMEIINWIQKDWECRLSSNRGIPFPIYSLTATEAQLESALGINGVSGVEFLEAVLMQALDNEIFSVPDEVISTRKQKRCLVQGYSRSVVGNNYQTFEVDFNPLVVGNRKGS